MVLMARLRGYLGGLLRRCLLALVHANDPWDRDQCLNLRSPALRRMMARALWADRRERGALICWTYSRDRVVERRELRCESPLQRQRRIADAKRALAAARRAA